MPAPSTATTLQDLIDRAAVFDVLLNYATGVDRRDWNLYRSIFIDEVYFDFSTWRGVKMTMPAEDWVAEVKDTLGCFDATQHNITNPVITLDGDEATVTAYIVARHHFAGEMQTVAGFYTHRLVRTDAGWKIAACTLVITWEEGDRTLFERAHAAGPRERIDVGVAGI